MEHTPIIHVGLPKTASTSLQKVFNSSDQFYYLGRGCSASMIDYVSPEIEIAAEIDLRFRRKLLFNKEKFVDSFTRQLDRGYSQSKIPVFSSEYLAWASVDEIDLVDKVNRLALAFPSGTKILMFVREQNDLLKSIYRESVRQGFFRSYSAFIDNAWEKQDRNWLPCLNYGAIKSLYEEFFGKDSVLVLPYEWYKESPNLVNERLNNFLGLNCNFVSSGIANQALDDSQLLAMRFLNEKIRHTVGNDVLAGLQDYFAPSYFKQELSRSVPNQSLVDERLRKVLLKASMELKNPHVKIDFSANADVIRAMNAQFADNNAKLSQDLNVDLKSLGYATGP
ncbi:hypothetical protein OAO91_03275 [Luminiphilus sp.]|nr:hypothetical protein [Luminiphilus sp.]